MAKQENSSNVNKIVRWNRREVQLYLEANRNQLTSFEIYCFRFSLFAIKETGEEILIKEQVIPTPRGIEFCFDYEMTVEFTPSINLEERSLHRVIDIYYKDVKYKKFVFDAAMLSKGQLLYQYKEEEVESENAPLRNHEGLPPEFTEDYGLDDLDYGDDYSNPYDEE